jgi:uncharacterized protein involved in outer membrane biogenesis
VQFSGLAHVVARDITLLPDGADTIAYVSEADVNVSLLPLLRGRVAFDGLKVNGTAITIYNAPERNNLRFLHSAKGKLSQMPLLHAAISTGSMAGRQNSFAH